jgi:hypothetical protein
MAANDIYRLIATYTMNGITCQNVLHFRSKVNGLDATLLANNVATDFQNYFNSCCSSNVNLVSLYAQKMNSTTIESYLRNYGQPAPGSQAAGIAPPTLCIVVTLRTGIYGRSKRGRLYMSGFPASWISAGVLSGFGALTVSNAMTLFLSKYRVGGSSLNWEFGVYSKKLGGYHVPYDISGFQGYTTHTVQYVFGTERGRRR